MKSIWRIIRFTSSLWRYYVAVSVLSVLVALLTQAIPLLTKAAIDRITEGLQSGGVDMTPIVLIVLAIAAVDFIQGLINNGNGYIGDILSVKLQRLLSSRYYDHIMTLPQRYFDTELTGTIINRLNRGVSQLASYMQFFTNNFLSLIISTLLGIIIVAFYSWPVALVLIAMFPLYGWLAARSSGKWQQYQKQINETSDRASGRFAESVGQVKVVKSFVQEAWELRHYDSLMAKLLRVTKPQSRHWHTQDLLRRTVLALLFLAMYMVIFVQTARGVYTLGTMVLLIQYIQLIRLPLFSISFYVDNTQRAIANSRDYFEVLGEAPEQQTRTGSGELKVKRGHIKFTDVSFGYEDGDNVLMGVTFEAVPGSKLALVGESGEGKTTITNLLLGLYDARGGSITIDEQDITAVQQASLRQQIGVVFQEPALFSGTVRENITYARPDATQKQVEKAARAANAHDFIQKFPNGYDTEIGERGLKLSGGQKQRIAIARALLKDAPILILDEATSSLDSKSEVLVQEALERLMKGRTTLIIAHRLSTIQSVDTIITLRGGKVDEVGSPRQLARSGGIYDQLLKLQQRHNESDEQRLKQYELQ